MTKQKIKWGIWIPVILALISSFTTLGVTWIQAQSKARVQNATITTRMLHDRRLQPEQQRWSKVRLSIKGFYASTNR